MTPEAIAAPTEAPAKPQPADPRTICRATPDELREFAELHDLWPERRMSVEERGRYSRLEQIISGSLDVQFGPAVLARALAAALEQDDRYTLSEIEFAHELLEPRTADPLPLLFILPSGKAVNLEGVRQTLDAVEVEEPLRALGDKPTMTTVPYQLVYGDGTRVYLSDPHDVAAIRARLLRLGQSIESPTLKGDDADGDGRAEE